MLKTAVSAIAVALASTLAASSALATAVDFTGDSLHGATGTLDITPTGGGNHTVVWSINLDGFDDAQAISTGHTLLTHVAFKAFSSINTISLVDPTIGGLSFPSNVGNAGCAASSPAGFVCVTLASPVLATAGGTFSVTFNVNGVVKTDEWSFRGKYGRSNGWVISESGSPKPPRTEIPEPTAAVVFGSGLLLVGARVRRRR